MRTVALYECLKGLLALIAAVTLLLLIHHETMPAVVTFVHALGLNPEQHYVRLLIEKSGTLTDGNKRVLAMFAGFYALTRFVIAFGLWRERHWAEWFAVISACVYFPFEIHHIYRKPVPESFIVPILNIVVVVYLVKVLAANRRARKAALAAADPPAGSGT